MSIIDETDGYYIMGKIIGINPILRTSNFGFLVFIF